VDAPKDDARTLAKEFAYLTPPQTTNGKTAIGLIIAGELTAAWSGDEVEHAQHIEEEVQARLAELLEAYALPFQQQRDAAQEAEVKRLLNLPGFNEGRHIGKMVAAGCSIDFANNELFVKRTR
jgi:hypothetical protein